MLIGSYVSIIPSLNTMFNYNGIKKGFFYLVHTTIVLSFGYLLWILSLCLLFFLLKKDVNWEVTKKVKLTPIPKTFVKYVTNTWQ